MSYCILGENEGGKGVVVESVWLSPISVVSFSVCLLLVELGDSFKTASIYFMYSEEFNLDHSKLNCDMRENSFLT